MEIHVLSKPKVLHCIQYPHASFCTFGGLDPLKKWHRMAMILATQMMLFKLEMPTSDQDCY